MTRNRLFELKPPEALSDDILKIDQSFVRDLATDAAMPASLAR